MGWLLVEMKDPPHERFSLSETTPLMALESEANVSAYFPYGNEGKPGWHAINPKTIGYTEHFHDAQAWLTDRFIRGGTG